MLPETPVNYFLGIKEPCWSSFRKKQHTSESVPSISNTSIVCPTLESILWKITLSESQLTKDSVYCAFADNENEISTELIVKTSKRACELAVTPKKKNVLSLTQQTSHRCWFLINGPNNQGWA